MKFFQTLTEQFVPAFGLPTWGGTLRSVFRVVSSAFFPAQPAYDKTVINYDVARQLYRNDGSDTNLGAGFCKPIIDRAVEFMGIPSVSSDDDELDAEVNNAIERHWKPQLQEIFRNSMRDSKTIVRIWQPLLNDKLTTEEERTACVLQVYEPERVTLTYDPKNPKRVIRALVISNVEWPDIETQPRPDPQRGARPNVKIHEIWEIITPDRYTYYDKTDNRWLDTWARDNTAGFVPMLEVWNEYDSALSGGQSDLESPFPFIKAFHEVMRQALQAHKYHSTPKLGIKVAQMEGFLKNNYPDVFDADGKVISGATISWKGREVFFIGENDEISFIEAKSVLGDSKVMMEFLIDCISISSETPEEMFMRSESGVSGSSDKKIIAFEKKIERKRTNYQPYVQQMVKMMMVMSGRTPANVDVLWEEIRTETLVTLSQSMQQLVMSLEVLLERKLISDNTARYTLRSFRLFRKMKTPAIEAREAQSNLSLDERNAELDQKTQRLAITAGGGSSSNGNGSTRTPVTSSRNGGGKNE
jgi:hypothetical protein